MKAEDDDSQEHERHERAKRRQQDHDDFHNEMAGREVGRINRFLPESRQPHIQKERRERDAERLTKLALALQNADYAALYDETVSMVDDYVAKAETGIEDALAAVSATAQALEDLTVNAARLHPSGEPVFMDENGNAVRADGTLLDPEEAASVVWPDNAPTYEEYLAAKKAHEVAQEHLITWREYQIYLAEIQNRLNDPDNPLSPEELRQIQKDIEEKVPEPLQSEPEQENAEPAQPGFASGALPSV